MKSSGQSQGLVLVVDDDEQVCEIVRRWLQNTGYDVEVFLNGESCVSALSHLLPDVICLDLEMPGWGGMGTLTRIKSTHRHLPVIILTGDVSVESAVSAMKLGAYDYLTKPLDVAKLVTTVRNGVDRYRMSVRLSQLEREVEGDGYPGILGKTPSMRGLFRQMDRVADTDVTVSIYGESGTGKELVAQALHCASGRRNGPFVALNCAAIPEALQESELFGHEKGAFTGATDRCLGKFELAHRGTLFLDEVAEFNLTLQPKLLRVLQERSFHRVGGAIPIQSDFRLVAATNRNLMEQVRAGRFREDLFFRIAVFELEIPPLRDRREDVPLLAQEFLNQLSKKKGDRRVRLSPEACELLMSYYWPGNVRELQNVMQRTFVLSGAEVILPEDLPSRLRETTSFLRPSTPPKSDSRTPSRHRDTTHSKTNEGEPSTLSLPTRSTVETGAPTLNLEELERRAIERAMSQAHGSVTDVVRRLGIGRTTLYRKLKKYGIR